MMRIAISFIALFLFAGNAFAESTDQCPKLPDDAGAHWSYQEGPDFSVCNAVREKDNKELFGVYLGNHPSFHPDPTNLAAHGKIGGIAVDWYFSPPDGHDPILLQTVFDIPGPQPGSALKSHVWVLPQRRVDLKQTFRLLARMYY